MDRERHGEGSSSPSVKLTVTSLYGGTEKEGSNPVCRVALSNGSSFFISPSDLLSLGFVRGSELSPADYALLVTAHRRRRIKTKALELMSRRDHCRRELIGKLEQKFLYPQRKPNSPPPPKLSEIDKEEIHSLCHEAGDELVRLGIIDDLRYAQNWVELRLKRHPEGLGALEAGLAKRGVERATIQEVLSPYREGEMDNDALERAGEKLLRRSKMNGPKLMRSLMAKGFSYPEIRRWLEAKGIDPRGLEPEEWD